MPAPTRPRLSALPFSILALGCGGGSPRGQPTTISEESPNSDAAAVLHVDAGTARDSATSHSLTSADAGPSSGDGGLDAAQPAAFTLESTCATAVVAGLQWQAPSQAATSYSVSRNGAALGSTASTTYADTTVTPSTTFSYQVTALGAAGAVATSIRLAVTTSAASSQGDPAYCPSPFIKSMTWNWSSGFNQQNGSDLWPATWGADGNVYTFFGDGGGFFGSDSLGRASFGIAVITGASPTVSASNASNLYGGLNAAHPSTINGKSGSLIAVGSSFYAIGSIYRAGDSGGPSGAPGHSEIVYSEGNAYSWKDSSWSFCTATDDPSGFCPGSFINYGKGNAGAPDSYVYVMGTTAESFFSNTGVPGPAYTYLVRVPSTDVLTQAAYETYAGLDATGAPVWSADLTQMQPIFTDHGPRPIGIGEAVFNPVLGRYIATGQGTIGQAAFYESVNPWGPWYSIGYYNTEADGTGGWGKFGLTTGTTGGDSLGINFVNAWTSADGATMWAQFSSDGVAPAEALLAPLAGKAFDSYSLVSVTLGL